MAEDWRKTVGFSERLDVVQEIKRAYGRNGQVASADITKIVRKIETQAFERATSKEDYSRLCSDVVAELDTESRAAIDGRHDEEPLLYNIPTEGATIGRYANAQHYADGLFSEVFKAVAPDSTTNSPKVVALKVTTPSMMTPPHDSTKEARILTTAASSRVIPLLDTFQQAGGRLILAFPFMPMDLEQLLRKSSLTNESRQSILRDLFCALAHLHALDIIHRDVKPSNILLCTPSGPAYLADFGIAWHASDQGSEPPGSMVLDVGTTSYRPPELLFGNQAYNSSLDMWAAGCVAAQVVCLGVETLFDSGELGSELALIKSIFETLGTPDTEVWPEAASFQDWGKMKFHDYLGQSWKDTLPNASDEARDLVKNLIVYESGRRSTAAQALEHVYLR